MNVVIPAGHVVKAGKSPKECSTHSRREEGQPLPKQRTLVVLNVSGYFRILQCCFSSHSLILCEWPLSNGLDNLHVND